MPLGMQGNLKKFTNDASGSKSAEGGLPGLFREKENVY